MAKRKKILRMLIEVSVPRNMTAIQARREVRTLINEQCNYAADYGDVRAAKVGPAPKESAHD